MVCLVCRLYVLVCTGVLIVGWRLHDYVKFQVLRCRVLVLWLRLELGWQNMVIRLTFPNDYWYPFVSLFYLVFCEIDRVCDLSATSICVCRPTSCNAGWFAGSSCSLCLGPACASAVGVVFTFFDHVWNSRVASYSHCFHLNNSSRNSLNFLKASFPKDLESCIARARSFFSLTP